MDGLAIVTKIGDDKEIITGFTSQEGIILPREVILTLLRHVFKFVSDSSYKYTEDPDTSGIAIEDALTQNFDTVNIKPLVTISRTTSNFMGLVLGDRAYFGTQKTGLDQLSSDMYDVDMLVGGMNINVYSKTALEAERIGWLIFMMLKAYKKRIEKHVFHDFKPIGISPVMLAGSSSDINFVTININYAISIEWISNTLYGIFGDSWNNCIRLDFDFTVASGNGENCEGLGK